MYNVLSFYSFGHAADHKAAATVFSPTNQSKTNDNYSSSDAYSTGPPISPHVNVPPYHEHVIPPPPLPPRRRERKEFEALFIAQSRQPPDAPKVIK